MKKKVIISVVVILALALLGVGIYFGMKYLKPATNDQEPEETTQVASKSEENTKEVSGESTTEGTEGEPQESGDDENESGDESEVVDKHPCITVGNPEEIGYTTWTCESVYMMAYDLADYAQKSYSFNEDGEFVQNYEVDEEKFKQDYEALCEKIKDFMDERVTAGDVEEYSINDYQLLFTGKGNFPVMMDIIEFPGFFGSGNKTSSIQVSGHTPYEFSKYEEHLLDTMKLTYRDTPIVAVMIFDDGRQDRLCNQMVRKLKSEDFVVHYYGPDDFKRLEDTKRVFAAEATADVWLMVGHGDLPSKGDYRPLMEITSYPMPEEEAQKIANTVVRESDGIFHYKVGNKKHTDGYIVSAGPGALDELLPSFADTLIFSGFCDSCHEGVSPITIPSVFLNHNAKAYLGYDEPVHCDHAFKMLTEFVDLMKDNTNLYSAYAEMWEKNQKEYKKAEEWYSVGSKLGFSPDRGSQVCLFARVNNEGGYLWPRMIGSEDKIDFLLECEEIGSAEKAQSFTIHYPDDYYDSEGTYKSVACDLPTGEYKVTATANGYETASASYEVTINANEGTELKIDFMKSGTEKERGKIIQVVDATTGKEIPDVKVKFARHYNNTENMAECTVEPIDPSGKKFVGCYQLLLEQGFYTLELKKDGYKTKIIEEYRHESGGVAVEIIYQMIPIGAVDDSEEGTDEEHNPDNIIVDGQPGPYVSEEELEAKETAWRDLIQKLNDEGSKFTSRMLENAGALYFIVATDSGAGTSYTSYKKYRNMEGIACGDYHSLISEHSKGGSISYYHTLYFEDAYSNLIQNMESYVKALEERKALNADMTKLELDAMSMIGDFITIFYNSRGNVEKALQCGLDYAEGISPNATWYDLVKGYRSKWISGVAEYYEKLNAFEEKALSDF